MLIETKEITISLICSIQEFESVEVAKSFYNSDFERNQNSD